MFLKADHRIRYGTAREAMEAIHRAGVEDVQIGTEEQKRRRPAQGRAEWRFSVGSAAARPHGEINVTPLIDIVLVLLIIFMVMTPVMLKELVAKVPQKQTENVPQPPGENPIVVELDAHDTLTLNSEPVRPRRSPSAWGSACARPPEGRLLQDRRRRQLRPRRRIMDICKGAGAATLGIVTKDE